MEKEFDKYLGGAPREAVEEFTKPQDMIQPDQLSEEDIMNVIGGLEYSIGQEYQQDKTNAFSQNVLDREKEFAAMFKELEQRSETNNQIKK